jgi:hypothetical protein
MAADERILVHCDHCGADWHVPASYAGHHGKCRCGHTILVPSAEGPPGTVRCPHCGRWTRPEGWCEWCSEPLETPEPVHLPDLHQPRPPDRAEDAVVASEDNGPGAAVALGAWFAAGVVGALVMFRSGLEVETNDVLGPLWLWTFLLGSVSFFFWVLRAPGRRWVVPVVAILVDAAGLGLAVNRFADNRPTRLIVPVVVHQERWNWTDRRNVPHTNFTVFVEPWVEGQPRPVMLSPDPKQFDRRVQTGDLEIVEHPGRLGLAWREPPRRSGAGDGH